MVMCACFDANSLSRSFAFATRTSFSVNRRAVSFTVAKASGRISTKISSKAASLRFSMASRLPKISSRSSTSDSSAVESCVFKSVISVSISNKCSLILPTNSSVLPRNWSLLNDLYSAKNTLIWSTIGSISFNAFSAEVPPSIFENDFKIFPNMISVRI